MDSRLKKHAMEMVNNDAIDNILFRLAERWKDEREYEDWIDYENALKKVLNEQFPNTTNFVSATKRPFGIKFTMPEFRGTFRIFRRIKGSYASIVFGKA